MTFALSCTAFYLLVIYFVILRVILFSVRKKKKKTQKTTPIETRTFLIDIFKFNRECATVTLKRFWSQRVSK